MIAVGAAAYYFLNRPGGPPLPGPQAPPVAVEQPSASAVTLPSIPFTDVTKENGITFVPRGGASGEKMLPETGGRVVRSGLRSGWRPGLAARQRSVLAGTRIGARTAEHGPISERRRPVPRGDRPGRSDQTFYGQGVAVGDYDGDGDADLFVTAVGTNHMFRNDTAGFTRDTAGRRGRRPHRWDDQRRFFDYDQDGDLDLFVVQLPEVERSKINRRVPRSGNGPHLLQASNLKGRKTFCIATKTADLSMFRQGRHPCQRSCHRPTAWQSACRHICRFRQRRMARRVRGQRHRAALSVSQSRRRHV